MWPFLVKLGMCLLVFNPIVGETHILFKAFERFPWIFADFEGTKIPLRNFYVKGVIFT